MVASLVPTAAVGKEHSCTTTTTTGTVIVGTVGDCPNTTAEVGAAIL
jgi:hypothetical protein